MIMKWPYIFSATQFMKDFYNQLKGLFADVGNDMQEQKNRVDNLIQNSPQPSELVDLRTDENGIVHPTARDRIISDKADLQENIDQNKEDQSDINNDFTAQLAEKAKGRINLAEFDSYKVTAAQGYDYMPALIAVEQYLVTNFGGGVIIIPPGTYQVYSDHDFAANISIIGSGFYLSTLDAKADNRALSMHDNSSVLNLRLTNTYSTVRSSSNSANGINLVGKNILIDHVWIDGGASAGIYSTNASDSLVTFCIVENTLADGYHNTNGSKNIQYQTCIARETGDDAFAVVSYQSQGILTDRIKFTDCYTYHSKSRGYAIVGGSRITVKHCFSDSPKNASFYIAMESAYSTYGVDTVDLIDITSVNSNSYNPVTTYAALHIQCSDINYPIKNIKVRKAKLLNSQWRAISIGSFPSTDQRFIDIDIEDLLIDTTLSESGITYSNIKNFRLKKVRIKNTYGAGVYDGISNSGILVIDDIYIENANTSLASSTNGITIRQNYDKGRIDHLIIRDDTTNLTRPIQLPIDAYNVEVGARSYIGGNKSEYLPNYLNGIPSRIGQIIVQSGISYIATGISATTDWKQITN